MGFCRRFDRPSTFSLLIHPRTQTPVVSTEQNDRRTAIMLFDSEEVKTFAE